jgi:hypothetical protein
MMAGTLYEVDLAAWAEEQVAALTRLAERHPELAAEIDVRHLSEELDEMRKSIGRELTSRLAVVLAHLAKWRWQPGQRSRSWSNTIAEQRDQIALLLDENPSLRGRVPAHLAKAWPLARRKAARETGLASDVLPPACPFAADDVLDPGWLPG